MRPLIVLFALLLVMIAPAAAQSSRQAPDLTNIAELIPADAVFYLTGRADAGYLETLKGLWPRLQAEVMGGSNFPSYETVFETGTLGQIINDTAPWRGDSIALAALDTESLIVMTRDFDDAFTVGGMMLAFTVEDRPAAEAWLDEELGLEVERDIQSDYTVYSISAQDTTPLVLLSDTHLILTTASDHTAALVTKDYAPLSRAEAFTDATGDLPLMETGYDVLAYVNVGAIIRDLNTREFITREMTPYRQFRFGLADFAGSAAFGAAYTDGQHLIFDGAWHYDDPAALVEMGFDPSEWITQPIDPTFFITASQDTQIFLQSTDLQGAYTVGMSLLSELSTIITTSPEIDRYFGMNNDGIAQDYGAILRSAATLGFAGLTGLNLEQDVLSLLDDTDFALAISVVEDENAPLGATGDLAFIARHTGGAEAWLPALSEAAALYGYPNITPQEVAGGQLLDFGPALDPMLLPVLGEEATQDPTLDPAIGVNGSLAAIGTRRAVEYALNAPTDLSTIRIAFPPAFSLFLQEPQAILYLNGTALQSFPDWTPTFESITASGVVTETGMIGRFTVSLKGGR